MPSEESIKQNIKGYLLAQLIEKKEEKYRHFNFAFTGKVFREMYKRLKFFGFSREQFPNVWGFLEKRIRKIEELGQIQKFALPREKLSARVKDLPELMQKEEIEGRKEQKRKREDLEDVVP